MPPNSMCEWMLGSNVVNPRSKLRTVMSFQHLTDDETDEDTYKVTTGRRPKRYQARKVRFVEAAPKSAMKLAIKNTPAQSDSEVSTDNESSADDATTDEEPDPDCPCARCISARRRLKGEKQARAKAKKQKQKQAESSEEETDGDSDAVHAKHKAQKAKKAKAAEAAKSKQANGKQKGKWKDKKRKQQSDTESEEVTDATESGEETEEDTEAETEEETEEDTPKKKEKQKGKNKGKKDQKQQNGGKKGVKKGKKHKADEEETSAPESAPSTPKQKKKKKKKKKEKKAKEAKYPPHHPPTEVRPPNLLLPPRSYVTHLEHAVEAPDDPRPNAFFDNQNGIMRVYHGPAYGNPFGALYPKRIYSHQALPVGTPHPLQNPWYSGFTTVAGQPVPPQVPPQGQPSEKPWFQGYGTVTVGEQPKGPEQPEQPEVPAAPDFAAGFDKKKYDKLVESYAATPSPKPRDIEQNWDSNVVPTIEISPVQGSDKSNRSNRSNRSNKSKTGSDKTRATQKMDANDLWGAQGASGSKKGSHDGSKKSDNGLAVPGNDGAGEFHSSIDKIIAKDMADMKVREERWSNKSGSKENSPQPGWDGGSKDNNAAPAAGWAAGESTTDGPEWVTGNDAGNNDNKNDNTGDAEWITGNDAGNNDNAGEPEWIMGNDAGNNDNAGEPEWIMGNDAGNNDNAGEPEWIMGNDAGNNDNDNNANTNNDEPSRTFEWVGEGNTNDYFAGQQQNPDSGSPEKAGPSNSPIPGTWVSPPRSNRSTNSNKAPSNASGGNVAPPNSNRGSTGRDASASASGNVGGNADDWGDAADFNFNNNNNNDAPGRGFGGNWGDLTAAQSSGGHWDKEGKGKEKETTFEGNFGSRGKGSWW